MLVVFGSTVVRLPAGLRRPLSPDPFARYTQGSSTSYLLLLSDSARVALHLLSYEPHNEGMSHSEKLIVNYEGT